MQAKELLSRSSDFIKGKPRVEQPGGSKLTITELPAETTIMVLEPRK